MDYKELVGRLRTISDIFKAHTGMDNYIDDAATAITDLLARAEAAEARAEKAEKKLEAAVKELDGVQSSADDLAEFIDEQIHPLVPYDFYTALRENADAISMWQYEKEWRGQKEE